jgi:hypothetical protein
VCAVSSTVGLFDSNAALPRRRGTLYDAAGPLLTLGFPNLPDLAQRTCGFQNVFSRRVCGCHRVRPFLLVFSSLSSRVRGDLRDLSLVSWVSDSWSSTVSETVRVISITKDGFTASIEWRRQKRVKDC